MKVSQKIFFQVKTDLIYLEEVLHRFDTMKQDWINEKDWLQCQLALAEGFTNAVRHAHKNRPSETPIDLEINVTPEEIKIKIWDYGQPFQLIPIPVSKTISSLEELASGGRGIEILQKIADELKYDHLPDNRNCLLIKKKL
ncbi:serine-protein kinase RsbW [Geminocystis sp. NIES-3708]|uniref:ATP-binding protein n=1 Tax=Geminocystis sp. NIES-3708 TaxID=1615909 RepID=UPI0005FC4CEC|nr:ATP-binding protein [Geminocystis sp. NIES-3708]BAQ61377.1 serine-protein kinase RsbW [Geminocystis sp. NIES-3708]